MPYKNEYANKVSHMDIVKNPEVTKFIDNCHFITEPSEAEGEKIAEFFKNIPKNFDSLAENIISIDGSYYEASVHDHLPSTKIGYLKVSSLLIDRNQFNNLRAMDGRFVDPFRVAEMQEKNSAITFVLPSSNIVIKGQKSVRDSFRYAMDKNLFEYRTLEGNQDSSLRTTLFHLASLRSGDLGTGNVKKIMIYKCPTCANGPIEVFDVAEMQYCHFCNNPIYPSDCLRIWEEIADFQSNAVCISRFMNVLEHLIPIHYIRIIHDHHRESFANVLSNLAFFVDGPLAVFGTAAWLHASIMRYLHQINLEMKNFGKKNILIIGLQKSGYVVDFFKLIDKYIKKNSIFLITDDYRYRYVIPNNDPSNKGFGGETYYGQDFVLKTNSGKSFIFALPYPFASKSSHDAGNFYTAKTTYENYEYLAAAIELIKEFECDLYENALIPVALAHKYTAISLEPGSKVLDLLSKNAFQKKDKVITKKNGMCNK